MRTGQSDLSRFCFFGSSSFKKGPTAPHDRSVFLSAPWVGDGFGIATVAMMEAAVEAAAKAVVATAKAVARAMSSRSKAKMIGGNGFVAPPTIEAVTGVAV